MDKKSSIIQGDLWRGLPQSETPTPSTHTPQNISEELRSYIPASDAADSEYLVAFRKMAYLLLNRSTFMIGGEGHRLTEIEFYFKGYNHVDKFTHGDKMQKKFGVWYFHKFGSEYRSGTYKGLDIAFGNADAPAGILIRGLERLSDHDLVDGPSNSVDRMLLMTECEDIPALAAKFDLSIDQNADNSSPLCIVSCESRNKTILATPRVGLSLKRENSEARWKYIARNYRFLTEPSRIKKGKAHMIVSLHQQGNTASEINKITGAKESTIKSYIESYESGTSKEPSTFGPELSTEQLCELFGACQKYQGSVASSQ
jgi:3-methyladenine DNA glycosylase Mpg